MDVLIELINKLQYDIIGIDRLIDKIFNSLKRKVSSLDKGIYFCDDKFIERSIEETFSKIDDTQSLQEFYYNNPNGEEKSCYLLYFDKGGIYVIDNDNYELVNLVITEFNGVSEKLDVLEVLVTYLKEMI